jgi:hypothetical protein
VPTPSPLRCATQPNVGFIQRHWLKTSSEPKYKPEKKTTYLTQIVKYPFMSFMSSNWQNITEVIKIWQYEANFAKKVKF